jgi:hypothetical protein
MSFQAGPKVLDPLVDQGLEAAIGTDVIYPYVYRRPSVTRRVDGASETTIAA